MTVIVVRDGIMAVDSLVTGGGMRQGEVIKYRAVPDIRGGGYIAGAGDLGLVNAALDAFVETGEPPSIEDTAFVHLAADGRVRVAEKGGWYEFQAPFYAEGSGSHLAIGALAMGATAEEAVKVACAWSTGCGGKIHILEV